MLSRSWRTNRWDVSIATPRRQTNVLQHMLGYFKQALDRESRAELLALIQEYGGGRVPLGPRGGNPAVDRLSRARGRLKDERPSTASAVRCLP
jgi:hypothetical protein